MLELQPISFAEACRFVTDHHRHHGAPVGHKFSLALNKDGHIVGVAIVGRPVARHLDDGWTLEVIRLCTDGTKDAASKLYGAARRATFALGYKRLITYILASEPGTSLHAAGWRELGKAGGGSRSRHDRPRVDTFPIGQKTLWEAE
jgi:hypothetical protein